MEKENELGAILANSEKQGTCKCGNDHDNCKCQEISEAELRRKLDLLLRTGKILVESAADTSRIMRTMKRTAAFLGLDERYMHLYVNWNVLMVNYSDEEHSFTKFQRCVKHGINLTSISLISKLSWRAIKEDYSLDQYEQSLNDVEATPRSFTPWHPLMACALFIVPGVPLINFVNDMLDGYIEVGMVRALNTLLMVLAMAFGIAFAIQVCHIDNFVKDLTMTPHHEYWEFAIAAAVSAMGFSTIFSIPRRLLPVVAVGGIIAVCFRNFVNLGPSNGNIGLDMGLSIGSLAGSALISVIVIKARHWFHTPHQCITIPSVIPMVPGVLMYRALFAFIDMHGVVGEVTVGMNNAIKASLAIICIALGVAIPNVFFRRFIEGSRKRKLFNMLVERKRKNGEFVDLHEVEIKYNEQ